MKKKILAPMILFFACMVGYAQQTEIELVRSAFKLDKKTAVANFMQLPDSTAAKFWPIYNRYETERSTIGDRRVKLLEKYAGAYQKLDKVTAERLWKESAAIQKSEVGLREKYADIMKRDISATVALNFYMVEDYIATAIKYKLYSEIPTISQQK
jgi:hypothetical protein